MNSLNPGDLGLVRPQTALLSVSEMHGLPRLGRELQGFGIHLLATHGTLRHLAHENVGSVTDTAHITGLSGRLGIKTIHPAIHAGIKAKRDNPDDLKELAQLGGRPIDIVVTNFIDHHVLPQDHHLDSGGGALLLQALSNCRWVVAIVSPEWYELLYHELRAHDGQTTANFRSEARAFSKRALADYILHHP